MQKFYVGSLSRVGLAVLAVYAGNSWAVVPDHASRQQLEQEARNSFIFVFNDSVSPADVPQLAQQLSSRHGGQPRLTFQSALKGFSATISEQGAANLAKANPNIAFYERNSVVSANLDIPQFNSQPRPFSVEKPAATTTSSQPAASTTSKSPATGASAASPGSSAASPVPEESAGSAAKPQNEVSGASHGTEIIPDGVKRVGGPYTGSTSVKAWVLDTGIDSRHYDLNVVKRDPVTGARLAYSCVGTTGNTEDGHGHGTHVAGTIGAKQFNGGVVGVVPNAPLIPVKVLNNQGQGTMDCVAAGVDWVAGNGKPGDVANLSLSGGHSDALHKAVTNAASKIRFAFAAGNEGLDLRLAANHRDPALIDVPGQTFTVAAVKSTRESATSPWTDTFASFSNYGMPPVDYAAPGVNILSTKPGGGTATMSGTSMAAPHVAGILLTQPLPAEGGTVVKADQTYPIASLTPVTTTAN